MISQQNEKSTQVYSRKSCIRSLVITAQMGEVGYQGQLLQKSQVYIKVY